MKRQVGLVMAALAALVLVCQSADAGSGRKRIDPRVKAASIGVGVASTLAYLSLNNWRYFSRWNTERANGFTTGTAYITSAIGCIVAAPMVATALAQRPLTHREVHVMAGGCVVPIIGSWLVNEAYNANPHWDRFDAPPRRR